MSKFFFTYTVLLTEIYVEVKKKVCHVNFIYIDVELHEEKRMCEIFLEISAELLTENYRGDKNITHTSFSD